MRQQPVSSVILAAALSACAHHPELLNSDRIEKQFGNYQIVVLGRDAGVRRSSLNSVADGVSTCRTYAVVQFADAGVAEIEESHQDVLAGQSIGTTFRESGWNIRKDTLHIGTMAMTDARHPIARLMQLQNGADLAVHVYRMTLEKNDQSIQYATIIEAHHPDYLNEAALLELYKIDIEKQFSSANLAHLLAMIMKTD